MGNTVIAKREMFTMKHGLFLILSAVMLLGSYKGYLALWEQGAAEPTRIYPCKISSLPPADQQTLEEGIPIHNQAELAQRLEDFLS
jgi:hypothetical protein